MKAGGEWTLPASFCIKKTPCYARGSESLSYGERKASYDKLEAGLAAAKEIKGGSLMKDNNSLAHTMYNCKYHIVFAPKYRRLVIYNQLKQDIGTILNTLIERKPGVKTIAAEACPDHIHLLL